MKFAIFDNYTGVAIDRSPILIQDGVLPLEIEGADDGMSAVLKSEKGVTYYREIKDGKCEFPLSRLDGVLSVYVKEFSTHIKTWCCERIVLRKTANGVLVAPNDSDLPSEVVRIKQENQTLRDEVKLLKEQIEKINERIDDMVDGSAIL